MRRGPDLSQQYRAAIVRDAEGLGREVDVHGACERVRDHQWRGGEVVHPDIRMDPPLEITVARQHGCARQAIGVDRLGDLR
jgi:hypothetical protein